MTQNNTLNVKLSNWQLNTLKSWIKKWYSSNLKLSWNVAGDSNNDTNFSQKLLLTNSEVWKLRKAFANNLSANLKLPKIQLSKIRQPRGLLGRLLGPLAKSDLIPLGITAAASETHTTIQKKVFGTLNISHEEINDIMKLIKSLEEFSLLTKGVGETIQTIRYITCWFIRKSVTR